MACASQSDSRLEGLARDTLSREWHTSALVHASHFHCLKGSSWLTQVIGDGFGESPEGCFAELFHVLSGDSFSNREQKEARM